MCMQQYRVMGSSALHVVTLHCNRPPVPCYVDGSSGAGGATNARITSLDGLRGIAALSVLFFHLLITSSDLGRGADGYRVHGLFHQLLTWTPLRAAWAGPEAVWIFFVLSGFVLARRYLDGTPVEVRSYYPRRLVRLYVPMIASVVFAVAVHAIPLRPYPGMTSSLGLALAPNQATHVLSTTLLVFGNSTSLNGVWWTLQWEVWFSLLLPIFVIASRAAGDRQVRLGFAFLLLATLGPAAVNGRVNLFTYSAITCLPIFGIGVALAGCERPLRSTTAFARRTWLGPILTFACAIGLVAPQGTLAIARTHHITGQLPFIVGTALSLLAATGLVTLALVYGDFARFLSTRPIHWLGTRSYSLYLVHVPILVTMSLIFKLTGTPWWYLIGATGLSLAIAEVFYRLVERPSIHLARSIGHRFSPRDRAAAEH